MKLKDLNDIYDDVYQISNNLVSSNDFVNFDWFDEIIKPWEEFMNYFYLTDYNDQFLLIGISEENKMFVIAKSNNMDLESDIILCTKADKIDCFIKETIIECLELIDTERLFI